uniref:NADH-ubiquinone oxidoreductase chain 6 n=1 Tax=Drilaster sp. BMNH 840462 TaxID=904163 RepID=E3VTA6_9COLE|nr:NADH dehydrogenase subunit 6 [Drilaster sp. BMNH 840462]
MYYMLMTLWMMTLIFLFTSHPLSMGLILLIQTLMISLITGLMSINYWFSYILFIIMIGGMLVLFIYMTSIASNEKFSHNNKILIIMMLFILLITFMLMSDQFINYMLSVNSTPINNPSFETSLNKYLSYPLMMISLSIITYLLITLIAVVKITNIKYGPLRQK